MSLTLIVSISAFVGVAALVGGVAMLIRGVTDNVAEDRLGLITGKSSAKHRSDKEASVISKPLDEVPNVLEELASRVLNLSLLLEQADIRMSASNFLLLTGGLAVLGAVIVGVAGVSLLFAPLVALTLAAGPLCLPSSSGPAARSALPNSCPKRWN